MTKNELYSNLFGFNASTYHRWKKENRPIINLIKYFKEEELIEFLETGKISKMESDGINDDMQSFILNNAIHKLINDFAMKEKNKDSLYDLEVIASAIFNSKDIDEIDEKINLYTKDEKNAPVLFYYYSDTEKRLLIENKEEVIDKLTKFIQLNIPDVSSHYQMNLIVESNSSVKVDDI